MAEANVCDLEALEHFLVRLRDFQDLLSKQREETMVESRRVGHWMDHEVAEYWRDQDRIARRKWTEARESLLQCQAVTRAEDHPSCTEHRKRLERWTLRVQLCERKLRFLKQAQLAWQQEQQTLHLKIQHLADLVESRLPLARHHLERLLEPLRKYASMQSAPLTTEKREST